MSTLVQFRQAFAKEVGPFWSGTAAAATSTVNALYETAWPVSSQLDQDDLFEHQYILRPNKTDSDRVRLVKQYTALTGEILPDLAWATAPTTYEFHGVFDPHNVYPDLLNEALRHCYEVVEITFTPAASTYTRHNISGSNTWLVRPEWMFSAGVLPTGQTDRNIYTPSPITGRPYIDGTTVYLEAGPFLTTDTLYITCIRPWYSNVSAAAGGGVIQSGFSLEADNCAASLDWVTAMTLAVAWRKHRRVLEPISASKLVRDQMDANEWANLETARNLKLPKRTLWPIKSWGPLPWR